MDINPYASFDRLTSSGYSSADMEMYYRSTYIAYMLEDEDTYKVGYVRQMDRASAYVTRGGSQEEVPIRSCYRFVIPCGFYLIGWDLVQYNYLQNRSHKKGLSADHIQLDGFRGDTDRFLESALYPQLETPNMKIISPKIALVDGKIISGFQRMTLGGYSGSTLKTKFSQLHDRMGEGYA